MTQQPSKQSSSSLPIPLNRQTEIIRLHNEIVGQLRQSLENAIRIGQLLTEQKASMPHGGFTVWVEKNLPFTDRTARNYMRVYRERDQLKTETVSDLTGAYRLLGMKERVDQTHKEPSREMTEEPTDDPETDDLTLGPAEKEFLKRDRDSDILYKLKTTWEQATPRDRTEFLKRIDCSIITETDKPSKEKNKPKPKPRPKPKPMAVDLVNEEVKITFEAFFKALLKAKRNNWKDAPQSAIKNMIDNIEGLLI